jgi:hypothetical protein
MNEPSLRRPARPPDPFADTLQRRADRLCHLIMTLELEWVDVAIQIEGLRDFVRERSPGKLQAFALIYEPRFHRFWEQWRPRRDPEEPW